MGSNVKRRTIEKKRLNYGFILFRILRFCSRDKSRKDFELNGNHYLQFKATLISTII